MNRIDEKITDLINPEFLKHIPKDVMDHALTGPIQLIKREHAALYHKFETQTETSEDVNEMKEIINGIFVQRMKKHGFM